MELTSQTVWGFSQHIRHNRWLPSILNSEVDSEKITIALWIIWIFGGARGEWGERGGGWTSVYEKTKKEKFKYDWMCRQITYWDKKFE